MNQLCKITFQYFIIVVLLSEVSCLGVFHLVNESTIYVHPDSSVRLEWGVSLSTGPPSETIQQTSWYIGSIKAFETDSEGKISTLEKDIPEQIRGRVSVDVKTDRIALLIDNVGLKDENSYYCKVTSSQDVVVIGSAFDLKLTVGPPVFDSVDAGSDYIDITWKEPEIKGVDFVGKYSLRFTTVSEDDWVTYSVRKQSYSLNNLESNTEYKIRIRAWDKTGAGPETEKIVKTQSVDEGLSSTTIGIIIAVVILTVVLIIVFIFMVMRSKKRHRSEKDTQMFRVNGMTPGKEPEVEPHYNNLVEKEPSDSISGHDDGLFYADVDHGTPTARKSPMKEPANYAEVIPSHHKPAKDPPHLLKSDIYIEPTYADV